MPAVVNFPEEIQTNAHTVVLIGAKSRLTGATASLPEDICQLVENIMVVSSYETGLSGSNCSDRL